MTTSIINNKIDIPLDIYTKDKYHSMYVMGIFRMDKRDTTDHEEFDRIIRAFHSHA